MKKNVSLALKEQRTSDALKTAKGLPLNRIISGGKHSGVCSNRGKKAIAGDVISHYHPKVDYFPITAFFPFLYHSCFPMTTKFTLLYLLYFTYDIFRFLTVCS